MKGSELYDLANSLVDDDIPESLFYGFINASKNRREDLRPWEFLKKCDSSQSASSGDSYLTSKALPDDFRRDYKLILSSNGGFTEYLPIMFEAQHAYKDSPNRYCISVANGTFQLMGRSSGGTIYLYYLSTTPDITKDTSPIWPERFHSLLAFDAAAMFQGGVDYDDVSARMAPQNRAQAEALWDAMKEWDNQLKIRSMAGSYGPTASPQTPLALM